MTTMDPEIPKEARPVARVLLLGPGGRLLLLLGQDSTARPNTRLNPTARAPEALPGWRIQSARAAFWAAR